MLTPDDVTTIFRICLDRDPENSDVIDETLAICDDPCSLISHILSSAEYAERMAALHKPAAQPSITADDVITAYRLFLNREPDGPGTIEGLISTAPDHWALIRGIVESAEFAALRRTAPPSLTAEDVVTAYQVFLGRDPESDQAISDLLSSAPDHWALTKHIIGGIEYARLTAAALTPPAPPPVTPDDVVMAYKVFLNRTPENSDTIDNLLTNSPDLWTLVRHLFDSGEFKIRMTALHPAIRSLSPHTLYSFDGAAQSSIVHQRLMDQFGQRRN